MDFRSPGQSNERRRRVRADDSAAATLPIRPPARSDATGAREKVGPRYAERGRPDRQPRLMDLVPQRRIWQIVIAAGGVLLVAGLLAGHWATHRVDVASPAELARSLDVRASDSLAAWATAGILASAAAMAILVYVVRRHRTDDYRGGYRVWLWAAAWMLVMSADAVAGLRDALHAVCAAQFRWSGPGEGVLWWALPCLLAAATIGVRLAHDMRECRVSTAWFGVATLVWTFGEVLGAVGPNFADALTADLAVAGCSMTGPLCLLLSMNWHARHVVLDASGALRTRKKKKLRRKTAGDVPSATSARNEASHKRGERSDAAAASAPTAAKSADAGAQSNLAAKLTFGGRAAPDSTPASNHLSKAQRKKLKREMRRAA